MHVGIDEAGDQAGQAGFAAPSSSMRPITPADQPISAAKTRRAVMSTRLARTLPDGWSRRVSS